MFIHVSHTGRRRRRGGTEPMNRMGLSISLYIVALLLGKQEHRLPCHPRTFFHSYRLVAGAFIQIRICSFLIELFHSTASNPPLTRRRATTTSHPPPPPKTIRLADFYIPLHSGSIGSVEGSSTQILTLFPRLDNNTPTPAASHQHQFTYELIPFVWYIFICVSMYIPCLLAHR